MKGGRALHEKPCGREELEREKGREIGVRIEPPDGMSLVGLSALAAELVRDLERQIGSSLTW